MHKLLPADAVAELRKAAKTGEPWTKERTRAIDEATRRIKLRYPAHFKQPGELKDEN